MIIWELENNLYHYKKSGQLQPVILALDSSRQDIVAQSQNDKIRKSNNKENHPNTGYVPKQIKRTLSYRQFAEIFQKAFNSNKWPSSASSSRDRKSKLGTALFLLILLIAFSADNVFALEKNGKTQNLGEIQKETQKEILKRTESEEQVDVQKISEAESQEESDQQSAENNNDPSSNHGSIILDDNAELLSIQDENTILKDSIALYDKTGFSVRVVTVNSTDGLTSRSFLDHYMDAHYTLDMVTFMIDMDNREIWIGTSGSATNYLSDDRIDEILDKAFKRVSDGDYSGCILEMISGTSYWYEKGIPENYHIYDEDAGITERDSVEVLQKASQTISEEAVYEAVN